MYECKYACYQREGIKLLTQITSCEVCIGLQKLVTQTNEQTITGKVTAARPATTEACRNVHQCYHSKNKTTTRKEQLRDPHGVIAQS